MTGHIGIYTDFSFVKNIKFKLRKMISLERAKEIYLLLLIFILFQYSMQIDEIDILKKQTESLEKDILNVNKELENIIKNIKTQLKLEDLLQTYRVFYELIINIRTIKILFSKISNIQGGNNDLFKIFYSSFEKNENEEFESMDECLDEFYEIFSSNCNIFLKRFNILSDVMNEKIHTKLKTIEKKCINEFNKSINGLKDIESINRILHEVKKKYSIEMDEIILNFKKNEKMPDNLYEGCYKKEKEKIIESFKVNHEMFKISLNTNEKITEALKNINKELSDDDKLPEHKICSAPKKRKLY